MTVEVECPLCSRHGRYRLARLAERVGAERDLGELLLGITAKCGLPRYMHETRQYEARCGARYRVPAGGPLPDGVPAREVGPAEGPPPRQSRRGPEGPLPTIADMLAQGPQGVRVHCLAARANGWRCHHSGTLDLARLRLPRDVPFAHIQSRRVLRCSRCGSHDVGVMPDWPSPQEAQARRMSGGAAPLHRVNGIVMPQFGDRPAPTSDRPATHVPHS